MGRRIIDSSLHAGGGAQVDNFFDKVVKLIPGDVVAAWITITGLIAGATISPAFYWILLVVFIALTAGWTYRQTNAAGMPPATKQIIISSVAFVVWVFALGGPFASFSWYTPTYGSIILIIFTLAAPLLS